MNRQEKFIHGKKIIQESIFVMVLLVISSVIIFGFRGDTIISCNDFAFMLSPDSDLEKLLYRWDSTRGLGVPNDRNQPAIIYTLILFGIQKIVKNIYWTEKILFCLWNFLSLATCFYLSKFFLKKYYKENLINNYIALIVSIFYAMNPFLYNYRYANGFLMAMFAYSVFPLLFLLGMKIFSAEMSREKYLYFLLFCLVNLFAIPTFENPTYFISSYAVFLPLLVLYRDSLLKNRRLFVLFLGLFILVNFWWLFKTPHLITSSSYILNNTPQTNENLRNIEFQQTSFMNLFRFQGFWATKDSQYLSFGPEYLNNQAIIFSSYFILSIIVMISLIRRTRLILIFMFFILIFIFIMKGLHQPFSLIFEWLISNTAFRIFRISVEKFFPSLMILYVIILSLSLKELIRRLNYIKIVFLSIVLVSIFFVSYPFWTNQVIPDLSKSHAKPSIKSFTIPEEYWNLQKYFRTEKNDFKVLLLPTNNYTPAGAWNVYTWSSIGVDPLWNLLEDKSYLTFNNFGNSIGVSAAMSPFLISLNEFFEKENKDFFDHLPAILSKLNVRYIIFRKDCVNDLYYKSTIRKPDLLNRLSSSIFLDQIIDNKRISLFVIKEEYSSSHIYIPEKTSFFQKNDDLRDHLINEDTFVYVEDTAIRNKIAQKNSMIKPVLNFVKINPTKYIINISNMHSDIGFVFSETYDPDWRLSSNAGNISIIHLMANGYANYFFLNMDVDSGLANPAHKKNNKRLNEINLELNYVPQQYFYKAAWISVITIMSILISIVYIAKFAVKMESHKPLLPINKALEK